LNVVMVKAGNDPRLEDDASAQIFKGIAGNGKAAICQLVSEGNLRRQIFDIFPYPIQMYLLSTHTFDTVCTILRLICSYGRNSYARRLNCISLLWLEHIHTLETISELNARVSYCPDM